MVVINEIELKKRAEHNYGRLFDLEEVRGDVWLIMSKQAFSGLTAPAQHRED